MTVIKSVVACLALANAVYFLWARGVAESVPISADAAPPATLQLVSEVSTPPAAMPGGVPGAEAMAGTGAPAGAPPVRCASVGPFKDVTEASHAAASLRGSGYDPRQRMADGEVWAGVWVFLTIPASRAASEQMTAKLKAGGIDDALIMPGPADASVMSLGLYGDHKRAQSRVAQVQALGLSPGMADRKRNGSVYWIDIDLKPTEVTFNPAALQGENSRLTRLEIKECPPAAAP